MIWCLIVWFGVLVDVGLVVHVCTGFGLGLFVLGWCLLGLMLVGFIVFYVSL